MEIIENYRKYHNLKRYEMAKLLGISGGYYSQLVKGTRGKNGLNTPLAKQFAEALNNKITASQILGLEK